MNGEPLLTSTIEGDRLRLAAGGPWTADHAARLERLIAKVRVPKKRVSRVEIDAAGIERLDTFGAWLLERIVRDNAQAQREAQVVRLNERYRDLFDEVQQANREPQPRRREAGAIRSGIEGIGRTMVMVGHDLVQIVLMFGAVMVALLRVLVRPATFRLTSVVHHLDRVGWRAVPIIILITFLIGAVIAQQGIFHFRRFGADVYVVDMVGILVLREVGVLIVAIMVAGRSGSAYTAELGSMKMREETDALRTMGFDPVEVLILPRIIALIIGLPILTFLGSMSALYGGGLVSWLYGGLNPDIFIARLRDAISLDHFVVGMIKAPFMALIIGVVSCVEGMQVKGSAESLGAQTTAAVVKAIFLVIVLDAFFAIFFASIGM